MNLSPKNAVGSVKNSVLCIIMVKIGRFNTLAVVKTVDFGVYLDGGNSVEILLPARFVPEGTQPGDTVDVLSLIHISEPTRPY